MTIRKVAAIAGTAALALVLTSCAESSRDDDTGNGNGNLNGKSNDAAASLFTASARCVTERVNLPKKRGSTRRGTLRLVCAWRVRPTDRTLLKM